MEIEKTKKITNRIIFLIFALLIFWNIKIEIDGNSTCWFANLFGKVYLRFSLGDISKFNYLIFFWLTFLLFKINRKKKGLKIFFAILTTFLATTATLGGENIIITIIIILLAIAAIVMLIWEKLTKTIVYTLIGLFISTVYVKETMVHTPQLIPVDSVTTIGRNWLNKKEELVQIDRGSHNFYGKTIKQNFFLRRFHVIGDPKWVSVSWQVEDEKLYKEYLSSGNSN